MKLTLALSIFASLSILASDVITPIPLTHGYDRDKALLGKMLFHDVRLSRDNSISCSSCHLLDQGGVNSTKYSIGVDGQKGTLNSPTVLNAVYNLTQMRAGSAKNLQEQAHMAITNPIEMDTDMKSIVSKLNLDSKYRRKFIKMYSDAITGENILDAIAEFEKALTTPNSRFDRYLRGEQDAMNAYELEGYRLFKENGCTSCHNGVNIGSNLYQRIGISREFIHHDSDSSHELGRFNVTQKIDDKFMVKVPTLRNIDLTAPYLHNGSLSNLRSVVSFMLEYQVGVVDNQDETLKIVAFLKTLTGQTPEILKSDNEK